MPGNSTRNAAREAVAGRQGPAETPKKDGPAGLEGRKDTPRGTTGGRKTEGEGPKAGGTRGRKAGTEKAGTGKLRQESIKRYFK